MESYCCSLSCLQFPEFSGNCAVFIPTAVKLQASTVLGFINKRTAITQENSNHTFFSFSRGRAGGQANQRLYFKLNLKCVRANVSSFFHMPRRCKQFSCMFETCFHMRKSLMWYIQVKKVR